MQCLYSEVYSEIKATKVIIVSTGTFPIELSLMYEGRTLLATRAKYRKLSFMLLDAILSGQGWFMTLSGTIEVKQKCVTVCHLEKLRAANVGIEGLGLFCTLYVLKNIYI